jgi:hypothetical protein
VHGVSGAQAPNRLCRRAPLWYGAAVPAKSKRQAGYLGAIIAGKVQSPHITPTMAREMLRGSKVKRLPKQKTSKRSSKREKRVGK